VEKEAAWCQEAMWRGFNATAKKINICGKSKMRCNNDIKELRNAVWRQRRRRQNLEEAARAKKEHQMSMRQSKNQI
jgi:hypothetical protein